MLAKQNYCLISLMLAEQNSGIKLQKYLSILDEPCKEYYII